MSKLAAPLILITYSLPAQPITGLVVDRTGAPIAGANIDHHGDMRRAYETDASGRFTVGTKAPALVIRKAGYQSAWLRTAETNEPRATLRKLDGGANFPVCAVGGKYTGIDGESNSFHFRETPGVKVGRQGADVDYQARGYFVKTKQRERGIRHGRGPMWTLGIPSNHYVWQSVNYSETTYDDEGSRIIDARGQLPDGSHWRTLTRLGESATYADAEQATAQLLDKFLDSACLQYQLRK